MAREVRGARAILRGGIEVARPYPRLRVGQREVVLAEDPRPVVQSYRLWYRRRAPARCTTTPRTDASPAASVTGG